MRIDFKWEFNRTIGDERIGKMMSPPAFEA